MFFSDTISQKGYLIIKRIAESKLFDIAGKTSFQAAEEADLYEAFLFLSAENAIVKMQNEILTLAKYNDTTVLKQFWQFII